MSKNSLRSRTIRLAHENKELRPHLLKALKAFESDMAACGEGDLMAGRKWETGKGKVDDNIPYNGPHNLGVPAGANGSAQREKYNEQFRKQVCPGHKTNCGMEPDDPRMKSAAYRDWYSENVAPHAAK